MLYIISDIDLNRIFILFNLFNIVFKHIVMITEMVLFLSHSYYRTAFFCELMLYHMFALLQCTYVSRFILLAYMYHAYITGLSFYMPCH